MREGEHAGLQQREVGVVAAVQRQLLDRARADQITQLRARRVDERRCADHDVLDLEIAKLQGEVQRQRFGDRQLEVAAGRAA